MSLTIFNRTINGQKIRDAIVGLPDNERTVIITAPTTEQEKVISIQKQIGSRLNIKYIKGL